MPSAMGKESVPGALGGHFRGEGMGLGLSLNMDQWKKSFQPPESICSRALDTLEELKTWVSADDALLVADETRIRPRAKGQVDLAKQYQSGNGAVPATACFSR